MMSTMLYSLIPRLHCSKFFLKRLAVEPGNEVKYVPPLPSSITINPSTSTESFMHSMEAQRVKTLCVPHLSHEPLHLVLGSGEGGGSTHRGLHHLRVDIQILEQVLEPTHGRGDLQGGGVGGGGERGEEFGRNSDHIQRERSKASIPSPSPWFA